MQSSERLLWRIEFLVAIALEKRFLQSDIRYDYTTTSKHPENCFTMSKPTEKYFFFAELRPKLSFKKQKKLTSWTEMTLTKTHYSKNNVLKIKY